MDFRQHCVFVTGGTGYVVRALITLLLDRGHEVRAVRPGSEKNLPPGCQAVLGDAREGNSYAGQIQIADTFVQLVGGFASQIRRKPPNFAASTWFPAGTRCRRPGGPELGISST
jgi:uncharacterized protein YbjT (DUF2867 family)